MDAQTRKQLENALALAQRAVDVLQTIVGQENPVVIDPTVAAIVAERIENRICLGCLKRIEEGQRVKRGNHVSCYQTQRTRISKGDLTERELVERGKWTSETGKPGRKAAVDLATDFIAASTATDISGRERAQTLPKPTKRNRS